MIEGLPQRYIDNSTCSYRQYRGLFPVIKKMAKLNLQASIHGLISIDDLIYTTFPNNKFARVLLQLAVEGTDSKILKDITLNLIISSGKKGKELAEMLIIAEAVLILANEEDFTEFESSCHSLIEDIKITNTKRSL